MAWTLGSTPRPYRNTFIQKTHALEGLDPPYRYRLKIFAFSKTVEAGWERWGATLCLMQVARLLARYLRSQALAAQHRKRERMARLPVLESIG
jgi:hypothetical protein